MRRMPGSDHPFPSPTARLAAMALALAGLCAPLLAGCVQPGAWALDRHNLLAGGEPRSADGAAGLGRITDGETVEEGAEWNTARAVILPSDAAWMEFDLGASRPVACLVLQADNNDYYEIEISDRPDGPFTALMTMGPLSEPGLRTRYADGIAGEGRFIRLRAAGGDGAYSVSEFAAYSERPAIWPPVLSLPRTATAQIWIVAWAAAMIVWILAQRRGGRPWRHLFGLPAALTAIGFVLAMARAWPGDAMLEAFCRAVIAAAAGILAVWDAFAPARRSPGPRFLAAALAVLCLFGAGAYYHFGAPQFRHAGEGRATYVHTWDLRNYYPLAKYFPELRYDGVYEASVAAYLDNHPELDSSPVAGTLLRDLTNNKIVTAGEVMPNIEAVRARFTPERWEAFRRDMAGIEAMMGAGEYLGSMRDHGGNATPAWVTAAHLLWRWTPWSETFLLFTALIDPLLLVLLFIVIARTFGLRAMLVVLAIFVTTEFSRFGSNLVGSTLRYDWIVLLGLGVCALKARRWMTGGALVAWAGIIRGFPAVAALFLAVPAGYWLVRAIRAGRRWPRFSSLRREQGPVVRAAAGALLCVVFWLAVPSAIFSWKGSWGAWFDKIAIHMDKPNVNHVGLTNLAGFDPARTGAQVLRPDLPEPWTDWQTTQLAARAARRPLFLAGVLLFTGLAVLAARRARLDQAVLLGMFLVPVLFYPANYYLHYVFLLPLVAAAGPGEDKRPFAFQAAVLCAATVALYATLFTPWSDVCFTWQSVILMAAWLLMLGALAWQAWDRPVPWRRRGRPASADRSGPD